MSKIKHERTADCVVAGYRVHKSGADAIGSLLLGLYDDRGVLASVGVIGAFPMATRKQLFAELQPLVTTFDGHPWNWAAQEEGERTPRKNEGSRWNAGKDLSFVPLRPGAGGRGPLRLHGGRPVPAHRAVRPLAAGPRPRVLHLRPARPAGPVQPRRRPHQRLTRPPSVGADAPWTRHSMTADESETAPRANHDAKHDVARPHAVHHHDDAGPIIS